MDIISIVVFIWDKIIESIIIVVVFIKLSLILLNFLLISFLNVFFVFFNMLLICFIFNISGGIVMVFVGGIIVIILCFLGYNI